MAEPQIAQPRTLSAGGVSLPQRLVDAPRAPRELRVVGDVAIREQSVAIVGSRVPLVSSIERSAQLAKFTASRGVTIVSGGASGIDTAAHQGALDAGGHTVAVFGTGIDVYYPERNAALYREIVSRGGGLVSQFPDGARPIGWQFVARNRVIAGLADAVVVVEAAARSGALHTAKFARQLGRSLGAVPGSPGCDHLIERGASVIQTPEDIESLLAGEYRRLDVEIPDAETLEGRVLRLLGQEPSDEEELHQRTEIAQAQVAVALARLELRGLVTAHPGRSFALSVAAHDLLSRGVQ